MNNIPIINKIEAPDVHDFENLYNLMQKPIVLKNLFRNHSITSINTLEKALKSWEDVFLTISQEYSFNNFDSQKDNSFCDDKHMTFKEYVDFSNNNKNTPWLCTEQKLPTEIKKLFTFPYSTLNSKFEDEELSFLFIGNKGNVANMHFDGDFRSAFLYQIFGVKKAYLVPPCQSEKMLPMRNFSRFIFKNLSDAEKQNLMNFANGLTVELVPGDTLFIPTGWWHHFDYEEFSASFNIRLKRNYMLKFLGSGKIHYNYKSQAIAAYFSNNVDSLLKQKFFQQIENVFKDETCNGKEKLENIENIYSEIYFELYPDKNISPKFGNLIEHKEHVFWERQLSKKILYN